MPSVLNRLDLFIIKPFHILKIKIYIFFFESKKLLEITKKADHRSLQSASNNVSKTHSKDIHSKDLSLQRGFPSVLKGTSYSRDTEHKNL